MQKVTQEQLQGYTQILNNVADEAVSQYKAQLRTYAQTLGDFNTWTNKTKAAFRDFAAEQMAENGRIFANANVLTARKFANDVLGVELAGNYAETDYLPIKNASRSAHYWAGVHLHGKKASLDGFIDGCSSKLERNVAHAADICIFNNSRGAKNKKRLKFARVPQGPTCPFCIMLASRGFKYKTAATAGELGQYHDKCDCRILAGYDGLEVENYDYEGMAARYGQCRATVWDSLPNQLEWLKSEQGLEYIEKYGSKGAAWNKYTLEQILDEMDTRDRQWLFDGTVPEIEYETKELEKEIEEQRPHEIQTAERLKKQGFKPFFQVDYIEYLDEKTKLMQREGLSDFVNGFEIKTLTKATSRNTINTYLKSASKKRDCCAIVFDNSENIISNSELQALINKCQSFHSGRVYILDNASYWRVR